MVLVATSCVEGRPLGQLAHDVTLEKRPSIPDTAADYRLDGLELADDSARQLDQTGPVDTGKDLQDADAPWDYADLMDVTELESVVSYECPNGFCEAGESCANCPEDCPGDCCGNGILNDNEECDDGNNDPDDGCGEECQVEPVWAEPGAIIITEIMKDPVAVSDSYGEWLELYNTTELDIDITGWTISDAGEDLHKIFAVDGVTVSAESFLLLGRDLDSQKNGGAFVDYQYDNFNLSNKDDQVILATDGKTVDEVWYDDGLQFPDSPGQSLTLSAQAFSHEGNDLGTNWCSAAAQFGDGDLGTPGATNPTCN